MPDIASIKRKNKRDSIAYSLPVWLVSKLKEEYGEERGQAIFESLLERNKASIRVTDLSRKEEIKALLDASDSALSASGLVKEQGHFAGHDLFAEGAITIQDESSQLVAQHWICEEMNRFWMLVQLQVGKQPIWHLI